MNYLLRLQIIWIILVCFFPVTAHAQNVSVTESLKVIKTYPFSDPNPLPAMAINNLVSRFYPYFMIDGYSNQGVNKNRKVVTMENDFITVTVLSYTHLRAHETRHDLVCRLLLEKKK